VFVQTAVATRPRLVAALAAGAVLPLAFAPFGWHVVAVLSPAALWWLWEGLGPRSAARIGFAWGAGAFLTGTYWLYISIHVFGQAPLAVAILLMLGLVAIMALYPALAGYLCARAGGRGLARWLLLLPGAWVLAEWLRGWVASGFPWLSLGYSQTDAWPGGYAALAGVYGIGLAVAVLAGSVVALVRGRGAERLVAVAVAAAVLAGGDLLGGRDWTTPTGRTIDVALVQGAVPQDRKWLPEQRQPTKDLYRTLSVESAGADLIVWPEAAIPAVAHEELEYLAAVEAELRALGADLMLGMLEEDPQTGGYYNSLIALGDEPGVYRKRHLVPFGEYFPVPGFVRDWMRLMSLPYVDISRGTERPVPLVVAGEPMALSICYEDAFGAEQRPFLPAATLMVNVSNDAWFGDSIAPHQHLQISRLRAMEAGRYLLRATNTGISAVIGPDGRLVATSPQFETDVLEASVGPREGATPWVRWGNGPAVGLAALLAVAGVLAARRRRPRDRDEPPA
jgi:apolipoprotein N-acyltransferase